MIRFVDAFLLRLILWIGLPLLLVVLALGPGRVWKNVKRGWHWIRQKRLNPEEILSEVVRQHEQHVVSLRGLISQAEKAETEIQRNLGQSEKNATSLDEEARKLMARGDELGAKAALYKMNLERLAADSFRQQLDRQRNLVAESRRRLYQVELQLRQYEVGRSVLLSELAEAKTVEQQYEIARQFDPFNAVANWEQAEGMVLDKSLSARAMQRVYADISKLEANIPTGHVDPELLDAQLAELRSRAAERRASGTTDEETSAEDEADREVKKHNRARTRDKN